MIQSERIKGKKNKNFHKSCETVGTSLRVGGESTRDYWRFFGGITSLPSLIFTALESRQGVLDTNYYGSVGATIGTIFVNLIPDNFGDENKRKKIIYQMFRGLIDGFLMLPFTIDLLADFYTTSQQSNHQCEEVDVSMTAFITIIMIAAVLMLPYTIYTAISAHLKLEPTDKPCDWYQYGIKAISSFFNGLSFASMSFAFIRVLSQLISPSNFLCFPARLSRLLISIGAFTCRGLLHFFSHNERAARVEHLLSTRDPTLKGITVGFKTSAQVFSNVSHLKYLLVSFLANLGVTIGVNEFIAFAKKSQQRSVEASSDSSENSEDFENIEDPLMDEKTKKNNYGMATNSVDIQVSNSEKSHTDSPSSKTPLS